MDSSPREIGFVGLGIMGLPMAGHLLRAGHSLHVHTRTPEKAQPLLDEGALWCECPASVARKCELLLIMVTDTPDVEEVLFGARGAAAGLRPGSRVVDLSTINPEAAREFGRRLGERDVEFLDAPVTGGDVGAREARLTIMVGGSESAFEDVLPVLRLLGTKVVHVGPSGSGQTFKSCNQIMCAANLMGVCEALILARENGLDLTRVVDTLGGGAAGSWALSNLGPQIAERDFLPGFMIRLIQKDLRIVQQAASRVGLSLPATGLAQELFAAVEQRAGGGDLGTQAMFLALEDQQPEGGAAAQS